MCQQIFFCWLVSRFGDPGALHTLPLLEVAAYQQTWHRRNVTTLDISAENGSIGSTTGFHNH